MPCAMTRNFVVGKFRRQKFRHKKIRRKKFCRNTARVKSIVIESLGKRMK